MTSLFYSPAPESALDPRMERIARLLELGGRRFLAYWIREGADAEQMRLKELAKIEKNLEPGGPWEDYAGTPLGNVLQYGAPGILPEYWKLIEWFANQVVTIGPSTSEGYEMKDFVNQYLGPVYMALRSKNQPLPNLRDKSFTYGEAYEFVEQHADLLEEGDNYGPYEDWDETVFKLEGGWRIAQLTAGDVEIEGEQMNNCLRDNDSYHWTDKVDGGYIAVLSLRDPLNRPHVSASVRLDAWNSTPKSLVYTEGPLLKNNRALTESEEYSQKWGQFETMIQEKGGTIRRGGDDWEEDHQEEPYHADWHDETNYGESLEVDSLDELAQIWNEAKNGTQDWGRNYEGDHHEDYDDDGQPYYYYVYYGGREVASGASGLEYAVEEWADDVENVAGTSTYLDMEPRDFVGAFVLWATVLQDAQGESFSNMVQQASNFLLQKAQEPTNGYGEALSPAARQMMTWAAHEISSERSFAASRAVVPYADEDARSIHWQDFAPLEDMPQTWSAEEQVQWEDAQLPQQQQPQQPQVQQPTQVDRAVFEERRGPLVLAIRSQWQQNPTPEYLNELGMHLISNEGLTPDQAREVLAEVTGQEVGYRQAKVGTELPMRTEVPRFEMGENVKMEDGFSGPVGGYVLSEPYVGQDGEWQYYVQVYDKEGPRGAEVWPEHALHRPQSYDEPGVSTMEDWVGIPPEGEQYYRTAMADRTGNPEVDALIEEFLQMPQGDWTTDDDPYSTLSDSERAHGNCQSVTEHFVEFAKSKGFKAYVTDTDIDEMGYTPTGQGGEIGFNENDEMQYGFYPEHTIATVVVDDPDRPYGREYYIDFTASQYGYTDHPKVTSKTAADDPWGEMFQPGYIDPRMDQKPFPFIYSPSTKQIHWGGPGAGHETIENDLHMQGQQVPEGSYYGRYYPSKDSPDGNSVYIYDAPFHKMPWRYQQAVYNLIILNAPDRP